MQVDLASFGQSVRKETAGWSPGVEGAEAEIEQDWETWVRAILSRYLWGEFAPHHRELWEWIWSIERGVKPRPFIGIWNRGGAKSTCAEGACVALAARRQRRYGWYISGTQIQADQHVSNVGSILESGAVARYYPLLSQRRVDQYGSSKGWRRNRLWTAAGFVIDSLGMDTAARGLKADEQRPDFMVIDDIDKLGESRPVVESKVKTLTQTILLAGSQDCAVLAIQNLVQPDSIFSQMWDGRAKFLATRYVSGPIPALRDFEYEIVDGFGQITAGTPTWSGLSVEKCQAIMDDAGPEAFLIECQHKTELAHQGRVFTGYSEPYSVITWSEFARLFGDRARDAQGKPRLPAEGYVGRASDWGTTLDHRCATVWAWRPTENMPLSDSVFVYRELVIPEYPVVIDSSPVSPLRVAKAIVEAEGPWMEAGRMTLSLFSHEQSAVLNTYALDLPKEYRLRFDKWEPDRRAGIGPLQNHMQIIDTDQPNPFRPELQGRSRFYLVVADGQGALVDRDGEWDVEQPANAAGLARLRAELKQYHYPQDAQGYEKELPVKQFDDAVDALKALANRFFPRVKRLTQDERLEQELPEELRREKIEALPEPERDIAQQKRYYAEAEAKRRLKKQDAKTTDYRTALRRKYAKRRGR